MLKIWYDEFNWIIAHSPQDAERVYEDHVGQDGTEGFVLWDEDFTMLYEDDQSGNDLPDGAETGAHAGQYPWFVKASAQAWIDHIGRGFLACIDL